MKADSIFNKRKKALETKYKKLIERPNRAENFGNGIFKRYENPVLTDEHIPLTWRYDYNPESNPLFLERLGVNAVFNPGSVKFDGKYLLVPRVEGKDRKSFFAIAESDQPHQGFTFWDKPVVMPEADIGDTNIYDMRLTPHEDGWIYGVFCSESKDPKAPASDTSTAIAKAGIARTKNLKDWERLPNIKTDSSQQRNVVLHPEFIDGQYGFYTRPQDGFINTGSGGGIGWGLVKNIENPKIDKEIIIDERNYHTIKEVKNGQGPTPLKTEEGWLHLAHGVRNTAAGLRYVLYLFVTELDKPWMKKIDPGGYLLAPKGEERVGDVSNVVFSSAWIRDDDNVYIYYGASDTRIYVLETTVNRLIDYAKNTPEDPRNSYGSVEQRLEIIKKNQKYLST